MKLGILFLAGCVWVGTGWAGNVFSVGSGSWTNPAVWSGGVIPGFGDTAVLTGGYSVTVHDLPVGCGGIYLSNGYAGTLNFGGGYNLISNRVTHAAGNINMGTGTIEAFGGWSRSVWYQNGTFNTATLKITGPNALIELPSLQPGQGGWLCHKIEFAWPGRTNTFQGSGSVSAAGAIHQGGVVSNNHFNAVGGLGFRSLSPAVKPLASVGGGRFVGMKNSALTLMGSNAVYDVSDLLVSNSWEGALRTYVILDGMTAVISNATVNLGGWGITWRNTVAPAGLILQDGTLRTWAFYPCTTGARLALTVTNSALINNNLSLTFSDKTRVEESLLLGLGEVCNTVNAPEITVLNSSILATNAGNNPGTLDWSGSTVYWTNSSLAETVTGGKQVVVRSPAARVDRGTLTSANSAGSVAAGAALNYSNLVMNGRLFLNGYTVLAQTLRQASGTLSAGSSTIVIEDQFHSYGVFSNMTSTVNFGVSAAPASCNVRTFTHVRCTTPGKTVTFTNVVTTITGQATWQGVATNPVTWLGGPVVNLGTFTANDAVLGMASLSNGPAAAFAVTGSVVTVTSTNLAFSAGNSSNSFQCSNGTLSFPADTTLGLAGQDLGCAPAATNNNYYVGNLSVSGTLTLAGSPALYAGNVTVASGATLNLQGRKLYYTGTLTTNGAMVNLAGGQLLPLQLAPITCPSNRIVLANTAQSTATNVVLGNPVVGESCAATTVTNDAPASFPAGTNVVTWSVTDAFGRTNTCQQLVVVIALDPLADADGDGLLNGWEIAYGLDPFSAEGVNGASGDLDSDGVSNLDEYLAGTDPTNPDTVPPVITYTPSPNAAGWYTNDVTITFSASDDHTNVVWLTANQFTISGETNDCEIVVSVKDSAGNVATAYVVVNIDQTPPSITLDPGNGGQFDNSYPLLIVDYDDPSSVLSPSSPVSGLDLSTLTITLNGVDVTTNFYRFGNRALWATNLAAGTYAWSATVADLAGNITTASNTFTATGTVNTNAPVLSDLDLPEGVTILPDMPEVWVQGKVSGTGAIVKAQVNGGEWITMNRREDIFGYLLPMEPGTNVVVLVATDASTNNPASQVVLLERSDSYQAALDWPAFGKFANGETQAVTGAVSREFTAKDGSKLGLASLTVAGAAVAVGGGGTNLFGFNVPKSPPGCTNSVMSIIVSACWTGTTFSMEYTNICATVPLGLLEGYEIVASSQVWTGQWGSVIDYDSVPGPCNDGDSVGQGWGETRFDSCASGNNYHSDNFWHGGFINTNTCDVEYYGDPYTNSFVDARVIQPPSRGLAMGRSSVVSGYIFIGDPSFPAWMTTYGSNTSSGALKFRVPFYYPTNTPVIFTLEGVSYEVGPGDAMELTNVVLDLGNGAMNPIAVTQGNVSYLMTVTGGQEYTFNEGAFTWPGYSYTTNYPSGGWATYSGHALIFSGFHNAKIHQLKFGRHRTVTVAANDVDDACKGATELMKKDPTIAYDVDCPVAFERKGDIVVGPPTEPAGYADVDEDVNLKDVRKHVKETLKVNVYYVKSMWFNEVDNHTPDGHWLEGGVSFLVLSSKANSGWILAHEYGHVAGAGYGHDPDADNIMHSPGNKGGIRQNQSGIFQNHLKDF